MSVRFLTGFRAFSSLLVLVLFFAFAGSAAAQHAIPTSNANACTSPEGFLAERLAVWQHRLDAEDWKISIVVSHPGDLKPQTLGNIHWDAQTKTAVIRVLSPSDYELSCPEALDDMEFTIVHELIHLVLSSLPRSEASRSMEERAVNRIADALVKLDRHRQP